MTVDNVTDGKEGVNGAGRDCAQTMNGTQLEEQLTSGLA